MTTSLLRTWTRSPLPQGKKFARDNRTRFANGRELDRILADKPQKNTPGVHNKIPIEKEQPMCPEFRVTISMVDFASKTHS